MDKRKKSQIGHRKRLRDKFLKNGIENLTEIEIIELMLSLSCTSKDVKIQAKELLKKFGTLDKIINAEISQLVEIEGIGKQLLFGIKFIPACYKRIAEKKLIKKKIKNFDDAIKAVEESLSIKLSDLKEEVVYIIFLDNGNRVTNLEKISKGTVGQAVLYPREVLKSAIINSSASVILIHNHPSGLSEPSDQDIEITKKINSILKNLEISLLDHIIVADKDIFSFKQNQLI